MKANIIKKISNKNNGILRITDVVSAGISKPYFLEFVKKQDYRKLARGIYISPDAWEDGMFILQSRFNQAVFSYETALYLLDLSNREPSKYEVTVKHGYNTRNLKKQGVIVYTVKPEWYSMGVCNIKTPMGNTVRVYNAERTLCDIFKGQCKIEIQDKKYAVKQYIKRKDKNIPKLMEYAKILKVEKSVKQYLEVLL
ncbi:MAG: abortive phage infection protein [Ruminococcus sp.]